jgi:serine protease AprX
MVTNVKRYIVFAVSLLLVSATLSVFSASADEDEMEVVIAIDNPAEAFSVERYIESIGSEITRVQSVGVGRVWATVKASDLSKISGIDSVTSITTDSDPIFFLDKITMNEFMGMDAAQVGGFTGSGILGQVQDNGCDLGHPDLDINYTDGPVNSRDHGTCTSGIVFSKGTNNMAAQGILPNATSAFTCAGEFGIYGSIDHLWNGNFTSGNAGMNGLFQSNSWGHGPLNGEYDVYCQEVDQAGIDFPRTLSLWAVGNSNEGIYKGSLSHEACSKNGLGVGGIFHYNTSIMSDDQWWPNPSKAPSQGPTADGRQKPDVVGPFDYILCTDQAGPFGYEMGGDYFHEFGGTSGATPTVAGIVGQTYQMYIEDHFGNNPGGAIPHSSTVKALVVANAHQYSLSKSDRDSQGWGVADAERIYTLGEDYHVIEDYPQALNSGDSWSRVVYSDGLKPLKATLAWIDPAAPGTSGSSRTLINNLDLKVTAPDSTAYWGNNGLYVNHWSTPGTGTNNWNLTTGYTDDLNNLENVFIESPQKGTWTVEVFGRAGDLPSGPQDFSLVVAGASKDIAATVSLDYPVAPDLILNDSIDIQWTADDYEDGANLDITVSYSSDGGSSWTVLETSPPGPPYNNDGSHSWDTALVPDGVDYTIKIEATDSDLNVGDDLSLEAFSVDNVVDDEWFFQLEASGPNLDLDMKPVEPVQSTVHTAYFSTPGQYQVGTWETTKTFTGTNINGTWTFEVYGHLDNTLWTGYLYSKVFASSGPVIPLDTTANDDENVGTYTSTHGFVWTEILSGVIPDGDSLLIEIWVNVTAGAYDTGQTVNPDLDTDANGWTGHHWGSDFRNSEVWNSTGGNPNGWIEIKFFNEAAGPPNLGGYWEQAFTPVGIPLTADLSFDWICNLYAGIGASMNMYVFIDSTPGEPTIGAEIWSQFLFGTTTWAPIGPIDVTGVVNSASEYYLKLAVWVNGVSKFTNAACGYDNVLLSWQTTTNFTMDLDSFDTQSSVTPSVSTGASTYPISFSDPDGPWPDWRLISFPIDVSGDVETVFNDTLWGDGGTTWDCIQWYDPRDPVYPWKTYSIYRPPTLNDMPDVNNTMGIWIHMTANNGDKVLSVGPGSEPSNTVVRLVAGWNLVGYPSQTEAYSVANLKADSGGLVTQVERYNGAVAYRIEPMPDGAMFMRGNAYWVYVTADYNWVIT